MESMESYRAQINDLDERIIDLLAQRTDIIRDVGGFKFAQNIPAIIPERVEEVRERAATMATQKNLDPELIRKIYTLLIDYSCHLEEEIMTAMAAQKAEHA